MSGNQVSKVSPGNQGKDADREILQDTSIEKQAERHSIFSRKLEADQSMISVIDIFRAGLRVSASRPCLGTRADSNAPFTWQSYQEVYTQSQWIGCFLMETLQLKPGTFVGIYSKNRPEWVIFELGCFLFGLVPVPLYDTLGSEAMNHVLRQTRMTVMLCESSQNVSNLMQLKSVNQLRLIVQITGRIPMQGELKQQVFSWQEALKAGRDSPATEQNHVPSRKSLALLCYTSGTTGVPKGVQITHGNLIAETLCMSEFLIIHGGSYVAPVNCDDVYLSYLPLAHIFERIMQAFCFLHGMKIGFYRGDILTLVEDLQELKPTIFCTVPRLLNRIYDKTIARVSENCLRAAIFRAALRSKTAEVNRGIIRNNSIWDRLVFGKIQNSTGGRIRLMLVGSAPLAEEVMRFSRAAFGCPVIEGYGQTETTGGAFVTLPGNPTTGNVGIPVFASIVKLDDVPDMKYFSKDGRGEICVKGSNITPGYYNMAAETAQALDKSGWLHTGDIGEWTAEGFLKIIDRKKHIFKLSQGEYIAPEKIEQIYSTNRYVYQIFVHGDSLENCILAVVVPNPETLEPWSRQHNAPDDMRALCEDPDVKNEILSSMLATGQTANLKSFEQVKDIHLHLEPFSVENGFLTPTFKAMRTELRRAFEDTFKKMYADLKQTSSSIG